MDVVRLSNSCLLSVAWRAGRRLWSGRPLFCSLVQKRETTQCVPVIKGSHQSVSRGVPGSWKREDCFAGTSSLCKHPYLSYVWCRYNVLCPWWLSLMITLQGRITDFGQNTPLNKAMNSLVSYLSSLVSVIRGQVLTSDGTPLIGVNVTFVHYPDHGYTITRTDGM